MAKRKKKTKPVVVGGIRLPPAMLRGFRDFLNTPLGKALLAEMLIAAAYALARRHPVAAAESAAAEAASGIKSFGANASEAAIKFLHIAADLLKSGKHGPKLASKDAAAGKRSSGASDAGNGASTIWDGFDEETIRHALVAALGQGKAAAEKKRKTGEAA
jgi:hypothetical protein